MAFGQGGQRSALAQLTQKLFAHLPGVFAGAGLFETRFDLAAHRQRRARREAAESASTAA